jgi:hypothetical protein
MCGVHTSKQKREHTSSCVARMVCGVGSVSAKVPQCAAHSLAPESSHSVYTSLPKSAGRHKRSQTNAFVCIVYTVLYIRVWATHKKNTDSKQQQNSRRTRNILPLSSSLTTADNRPCSLTPCNFPTCCHTIFQPCLLQYNNPAAIIHVSISTTQQLMRGALAQLLLLHPAASNTPNLTPRRYMFYNMSLTR